MGDLAGVQLLDQALGDGGLDDVVVGDDQVVVPALGGLELGEHGLVGVEVCVVHGDAGLLGKAVQHLLGEHPLPGVQHQFAVFPGGGTSGKGQRKQQQTEQQGSELFHLAVTSFLVFFGPRPSQAASPHSSRVARNSRVHRALISGVTPVFNWV